jgi:hypothetical protein
MAGIVPMLVKAHLPAAVAWEQCLPSFACAVAAMVKANVAMKTNRSVLSEMLLFVMILRD